MSTAEWFGHQGRPGGSLLDSRAACGLSDFIDVASVPMPGPPNQTSRTGPASPGLACTGSSRTEPFWQPDAWAF